MQAELELPLRIDDCGNDSGSRHSHLVVRQTELRRVEKVEGLSRELQSESLLERSGALQADVVIELARSAQNVTPGIAVGVSGRCHEGRVVEPIGRLLIRRIDGRARNHIRPRRRARISRIVAQDRCEREPGLDGGYTGKLPATQNGAGDAGLGEPRLAAPEGQLIDVACRYALPHIEVGAAVVRRPVIGILRAVVKAIGNLAPIVERVTPGVSSQKAKSVMEAPLELEDKRVIVRAIEGQESQNLAVSREGLPRRDAAWAGLRLVKFGIQIQVMGARTDIPQL